MQAAIFAPKLPLAAAPFSSSGGAVTNGTLMLLTTIRNVSCTSITMSVQSLTATSNISNANLSLLGAQGLEDIFNPAAQTITTAQPGSNCSAGITNAKCNFTVMGLNPAFPYHALLAYPKSIANMSTDPDARAVVTIASCASGDALPWPLPSHPSCICFTHDRKFNEIYIN